MHLIDPDEMREFLAVLQRSGMDARDFSVRETDTTDPKSDEIEGLCGFVVVRRASTNIVHEYAMGDHTDWVAHFAQDLKAGIFR